METLILIIVAFITSSISAVLGMGGGIILLDILNIVNFILSYSEPDFQASTAADVNGGWVINLLDIIAIVNMIIEQ